MDNLQTNLQSTEDVAIGSLFAQVSKQGFGVSDAPATFARDASVLLEQAATFMGNPSHSLFQSLRNQTGSAGVETAAGFTRPVGSEEMRHNFIYRPRAGLAVAGDGHSDWLSRHSVLYDKLTTMARTLCAHLGWHIDAEEGDSVPLTSLTTQWYEADATVASHVDAAALTLVIGSREALDTLCVKRRGGSKLVLPKKPAVARSAPWEGEASNRLQVVAFTGHLFSLRHDEMPAIEHAVVRSHRPRTTLVLRLYPRRTVHLNTEFHRGRRPVLFVPLAIERFRSATDSVQTGPGSNAAGAAGSGSAAAGAKRRRAITVWFEGHMPAPTGGGPAAPPSMTAVDIEPGDTLQTLSAALGRCMPEGRRMPVNMTRTRPVPHHQQLGQLPVGTLLDDFSFKGGEVVKVDLFTAQIFVKTMAGKTIRIEIGEGDYVSDLKHAVYEKAGVPQDQQRLIFAGMQLEQGRTLAYYGIKSEHTVHMVLSLRGD